ncbi:MAG: S8 family serine peptidase [Nitriliruptoraceae bacterium]|nr:S8 family serine peptidase [Nitriliruptoraceae bacterium]
MAAATDRVLSDVPAVAEDAERLDQLPYVIVDATDAELRDLLDHPDVRGFHEDQLAVPSLNASVPLIGASGLELNGSALTGRGTAVAVLDTGVDRSHPFFASGGGRILAEACFASVGGCPNGSSTMIAPGAAKPLAGDSHGTHVAGIIAGSNSVRRGVAPGADIIAVQVFVDTPAGLAARFSDIVRAMDWLATISDEVGLVAVNLSLGSLMTFPGTCDADFGSFVAASDLLRDRGVVTVAASGNEGTVDGVAAPACVSSTLAVGASTVPGDQLAEFSDIGPQIDLLAPGAPITSSVVGGGFGGMQGTSMAAPHVAGAIALLREAAPQASAAQTVAALRASSILLDDTRDGGTQTGMPRLDLPSAFTAISPHIGPPKAIARLGAASGDLRSNLDWSRPVGAHSYRLHRSTGSSCSTSASTIFQGNARAFVDKAVQHGSTYRYCVRAVGAAGTSPLSATSTVTGRDLTAPAAPSASISIERDRIRFSWPAVSDPTGPITYRLYRSTGSTTCSTSSTRLYQGTNRSVTIDGHRPGTTYRYCLTATDGAGNRSSIARSSGLTVAPLPHHGFRDVPTGTWFDVPVRWLVIEDITQGMGGPGQYSPGADVTRAQMAAFLWRAAGKPTGYPHHGFRDVPRGSWFDEPVRWLKAEGITQGMGGPRQFSPDAKVTRAQMAAFLWRADGKPGGYPHHGFRDVPRGSWFDEPVRWLVAEDITQGMGGPGQFSPDGNVTRAQMAAFLWRANGRPEA